MKYFVSGRKSGDWHEFVKGPWDGESHWDGSSIYFDDDIWNEWGLAGFLYSLVPDYDSYGPTEINRSQWDAICSKAREIGGNVEAVIDELNAWLGNDFKTEVVLTILGI